MIKETISLFYCEGSSDKFYIASIEEKDITFSVPFTFGRRGTSGQSGFKVSGVSYEVAKKAYDKVVKEKMGKGYKPLEGAMIESDSPHTGITVEKIDTGIYPQLLTPIEEKDIEKYLKDPDYGAQKKYNGKRKFLKKDEKVISINKKGQEVGYPAEFEEACRAFSMDKFLIDGEEISSIYYAFDLLFNGNEDIRSQDYALRYAMLKDIVPEEGTIRLAPLAVTYEDKKALYEQLKKNNEEGIVFKRLDAPYVAGRLGEDQIKCKFYATASCIAIKINQKRSVALALYDGSEWVGVGNCTIPPNREIPSQSTVVEIKYLYAHKGGSLYQPIYLGPRDDVDSEECLMTQLKYKSEEI